MFLGWCSWQSVANLIKSTFNARRVAILYKLNLRVISSELMAVRVDLSESSVVVGVVVVVMMAVSVSRVWDLLRILIKLERRNVYLLLINGWCWYQRTLVSFIVQTELWSATPLRSQPSNSLAVTHPTLSRFPHSPHSDQKDPNLISSTYNSIKNIHSPRLNYTPMSLEMIPTLPNESQSEQERITLI